MTKKDENDWFCFSANQKSFGGEDGVNGHVVGVAVEKFKEKLHDSKHPHPNHLVEGKKMKKLLSKQGSLDTMIQDNIEEVESGVGEGAGKKEGKANGGEGGGGGVGDNLSPLTGSSSAATLALTSPNVIRAFGGENEIRKTISKEKLRLKSLTLCPACGYGQS